jgi:hypothetical protein
MKFYSINTLKPGSLLLSAILIISALLANAYAAEKHFSSGEGKVNLIELYTSEGCSSCPPAEKWMNSLKDDSRLWQHFVPVAFHVDYWDYIGWKDPFANADYGLRQRLYKQQGNIHTVYTPGMILDGKEWRKWHYKKRVPLNGETAGNLDVVLKGKQIKASFSPADQSQNDWVLNIAVLGFDLHSRVWAGENFGRNLDQDFVVLGHRTKGSSNGKWQITLPGVNNEHAKRTGLAVWVNKKGDQTPVQATGGWL